MQDQEEPRAVDGRSVVNARQRTPAELSEQLGRDAVSLELTGASFTKDEAFYRAVASNLREAREWLHRWQRSVDQAAAEKREVERAAKVLAARACLDAANQVFECVPFLGTPMEASWRGSARAIANVISIRLDGWRTGVRR